MEEILDKLQIQKDKILQKISELDDFRQGSLSPRYRKCGKLYCHCAVDVDSRIKIAVNPA